MRTKARFMVPVLVRRGVNPPYSGAVPAQPTALAVSGSGLVWTDNADNETGYRVEESATGTGGWSTTDDTLPANSESYAGPLDGGKFYRVIAHNAAGDSIPSAVVEYSSLLVDLVAWWRLEESGTASRLDSHGANNATPYDQNVAPESIPRSAGVSGFGINTDGDDQHLRVSTTSSLKGGQRDWTLSMWVNPNNFTQDVGLFHFSNMSSNAGNYAGTDAAAVMFSDNQLSLYISNGSAFTSAGPVSLTAGVDNHILFEYDSSTNTLSITLNNGTAVTNTLSGSAHNVATTLIIAGYKTSGLANWNAVDGVTDEVAFWERLLTNDEKTAVSAGITYPG